MHAIRKPSPVARRPQEGAGSRSRETQSPELNASATSGTYFKAVRPEAAASARRESVIDGAKVEGLRFELEVGVWRGDSERIALCVVDDAEYTTDSDDDE